MGTRKGQLKPELNKPQKKAEFEKKLAFDSARREEFQRNHDQALSEAVARNRLQIVDAELHKKTSMFFFIQI